MELLIQVLVAVGFIVYSIYSEVTKQSGGSSGDSGDITNLDALEEFFRKKKQSDSSSRSFNEDPLPLGDSSAEFPSEFPSGSGSGSRSGLSDEFGGSNLSGPSGSRKMEKKRQPRTPKVSSGGARRRTSDTVARTKVDKAGDGFLSGEVPFEAIKSISDVNYDEIDALETKAESNGLAQQHEVNYDLEPGLESHTLGAATEKGKSSAAFTANKGGLASRPRKGARPRFRFPMGKNDILRGVVFSEIMRRYDMSRVFERIPAVAGKDIPKD